jgi:MSHA biogenesis protein MshQ
MQFFCRLAWLCALHLVGAALLWFSADASAAVSVTGVNSVSTGSVTTAASLVVTPVSGAQRADLLVAQVTLDDVTAAITKPTGWTEISSIAQSVTGIQQRIYWTVRSNTEPASYTWSFSKAVHGALILADVTGVDTNQAINAVAGGSGSGSTLTAPEVAASYQNGMLMAFFGSNGVASSITPQASMTVPANCQISAASGGGGVQLALAVEQVASDGLTGVRTATGASGNFIGQTIALTPAPTPQICFTDNFNRSALGSDWVTSNSRGGFNPIINTTAGNQRLQLTQDTTYQATLAILQRYFPAAGNLVVVNFKHYAYPHSSGADGIVTIFSDAAVSPVAGGSGGSLGYAQYTSPANTPGFAGGWLGVGIDEFGNFSNPTENRFKGPGVRANSVSIRGPANSFYASSPANTYSNGYPYVQGTAALSPIIGSAATVASGGGPGYLYRITIDSRVPGEQWLQVERSTDGGVSYTAIVASFNLMSSLASVFPTTTLPAIPANFWLSFTGGTGGSTNIHEIDNLSVCATKMIAATAAIDHFRFENPGTMNTCQPATIKVTACTAPEPACTPFTGGDVYVTLKPTGWIGGDTVKLIGGAGTLQLSQSTTGTVTLDIDKTKSIWPALIDPATYASKCVVPGTSTSTSCNLTVAASAAGLGITFPGSSQVACDDSGDVLIKACSSGYANQTKNLQFWFGYTDPPSETANTSSVLTLSKDAWATTPSSLATASPTSATVPAVIPVSFDSSGTAKVRVKYSDVGKLTLNVRDSAATTVTGSNTLIVRPSTFVVTGITDMALGSNPAAVDAAGTKFVGAGTSFKVTAEARNSCSPAAAVKNFGKESTPEGIKFDKSLVTGLGLTNNPALVTVADFSFSNGAGTATLNWPEVGIIKLTPRLKSGSYMGTADVLGATTGNVGRFYADHLDVTGVTQGCAAGAFTYSQQPFPSLSIAAKAKGGTTALKNYQGSTTPAFSFAKAVTLTDSTSKGTITITTPGPPILPGVATVPAVAFSNGSATLNKADPNQPFATFAFNVNPTGPSTISIAATDTDNVAGIGVAGSATMLSGRLHLLNAYGSDLLALPIPFEAQNWTGSNYATNTLDSCTQIPMSSIMMGLYVAPLAACNTQVTPTGNQTLVAGKVPGGIVLTKPSVSGSVNLAVNVGDTASGNTCVSATQSAATAAAIPWFGTNPTSHATFGIYKSPLIYRRENY